MLQKRIAMTGARTFLNTLLLKKLAFHQIVQEIHIFDIHPPTFRHPKLIFHKVDLTEDTATDKITKILTQNEISLVIHGALFSGPTRHHGNQHEVESIGTFHLLNALAAAKTQKLVVNSHTFVYGAHPKNPNFIIESAQLNKTKPYFVKIRCDVEKQIDEFGKIYKDCAVTVLRYAPILGPHSTNMLAKYFLANVVPVVMGYDPLLQFIHEEDALDALWLAIESPVRGVLNIVGKGLISLTTAIHLSGKIPFPVPLLLCKSIFGAGYVAKVWELDSCMVPFFQYLCVASGESAQKKLKFSPYFSSRQALKSMLEATALRQSGFASPLIPLGEEGATTGGGARGFQRLNL